MSYRKKSISWVWIVLGFIVFWPIGLVLLFIKLSADRSTVVKSASTGKILSTVAWVLIALGVLFVLAALGGEPGMIGMALLFGGGGIFLNRFAKLTRGKGVRYKRYIELIVNQNEAFIHNIAHKVNVPYKVAARDLQNMINAGYFSGAFIDHSRGAIVLAKPPAQVFAAPAPSGKAKDVNCESCGARARIIIGTQTECEYCNSLLG
jgi:hypothetical protein